MPRIDYVVNTAGCKALSGVMEWMRQGKVLKEGVGWRRSEESRVLLAISTFLNKRHERSNIGKFHSNEGKQVIDIKKFAAWLGEFEGDTFKSFSKGAQPGKIPLAKDEKVYGYFKDDFYISPDAVFIHIESEWVRLPWKEIEKIEPVNLKKGYFWEFKTRQGAKHRYFFEKGYMESPIDKIVEHCFKELGVGKQTDTSRRPFWEYPKEIRGRELWYRDSVEVRHPDEVAPLRAADAAYDEALKQQKLSPDNIQPIVDCARSKLFRWQTAVGMLGNLALDHKCARDEIEAMAQDRSAHVRHNAVHCLSRKTPPEFSVKLLRNALDDKSAKVRLFAIQKIKDLKLDEMISDLENLEKIEKDKKVKRTLDLCLALLRDGIFFEKLPDGRISYWVQCVGSVAGGLITEKELNEMGNEALIKLTREQNEGVKKKV